jgi:hypothetical protein
LLTFFPKEMNVPWALALMISAVVLICVKRVLVTFTPKPRYMIYKTPCLLWSQDCDRVIGRLNVKSTYKEWCLPDLLFSWLLNLVKNKGEIEESKSLMNNWELICINSKPRTIMKKALKFRVDIEVRLGQIKLYKIKSLGSIRDAIKRN